MTECPKKIYQTHLDVCSAAYFSEDYAALLQHLALPGYMSSSDQERWVETPEELEECLRTARERLRSMGAQEYIRVCREATFEGTSADRIVGEHDTFILRGGQSVIPPYRSVMTLDCESGHWTARGITSDVSNLDYTLFSTRLMSQFVERQAIVPKRRSLRR